jgi:hypothetical protein
MRRASVAALGALVGTLVLSWEGTAVAQEGSARSTPEDVKGRGTPGTVPLWGVQGRRLTDSHIRDNGQSVFVGLPLQVTGTGTAHGLSGIATGGSGVSGHSTANNGVTGSTDATSGGAAGVAGFGVEYGVLGFASNTDVGWGVKGVASGTAVGVEGISEDGAGIRGNALRCDQNGCSPATGDAGQFVAGAGANLLHGFLANFNGPGGWDEKFRVGADGSGFFGGDLTVSGDAFKPGGGSWSTLSDRRVKTSIEPIEDALGRLLRLHGVSFEYTDPGGLRERPGRHIGMVAQDVEQVFPSWVDEGADGYRRVTFRGFEALAVEAVRELDAQVSASSQEALSRIEALERQNAELRNALREMSERIAALRKD